MNMPEIPPPRAPRRTLRSLALLAGLAVSASASPEVILHDTFDQTAAGRTPENWMISAPRDTRASVEPSDRGLALRLSDADAMGGPTDGFVTASRSFAPQSGRVSISWRMRQEQASNWNRFFVQSDQWVVLEMYTTNAPVGEGGTAYGLYARNVSGDDILVAELSAGAWHAIDVVVDTETNTAEVRINGQVPTGGARVPLRLRTGKVTGVLFGTGGSTSQPGLWIDDLLVRR